MFKNLTQAKLSQINQSSAGIFQIERRHILFSLELKVMRMILYRWLQLGTVDMKELEVIRQLTNRREMESQRKQIQILFESLNPGDLGTCSRSFFFLIKSSLLVKLIWFVCITCNQICPLIYLGRTLDSWLAGIPWYFPQNDHVIFQTAKQTLQVLFVLQKEQSWKKVISWNHGKKGCSIRINLGPYIKYVSSLISGVLTSWDRNLYKMRIHLLCKVKRKFSSKNRS